MIPTGQRIVPISQPAPHNTPFHKEMRQFGKMYGILRRHPITSGKSGDTSFGKMCRLVSRHPVSLGWVRRYSNQAKQLNRPDFECKLISNRDLISFSCHERTIAGAGVRTVVALALHTSSRRASAAVPDGTQLELLADPMALTFADPDHSEDEDRFLTFGQSGDALDHRVAHRPRRSHSHDQCSLGDAHGEKAV